MVCRDWDSTLYTNTTRKYMAVRAYTSFTATNGSLLFYFFFCFLLLCYVVCAYLHEKRHELMYVGKCESLVQQTDRWMSLNRVSRAERIWIKFVWIGYSLEYHRLSFIPVLLSRKIIFNLHEGADYVLFPTVTRYLPKCQVLTRSVHPSKHEHL